MKKRASSAAALVGATALWLTLDQTTQPLGGQEDATESLNQTYLSSVSHWRFDATGARQDTLNIDHAERKVGRGDTQLEGIDFLGRDDEGYDWSVAAGSGVWWEGAEQLNLRGDVRVQSDANGGILTTPDLNLSLANNTAQTGSRIELTTPESRTTGYGLDMNLDQGKVTIRNNVETTYRP